MKWPTILFLSFFIFMLGAVSAQQMNKTYSHNVGVVVFPNAMYRHLTPNDINANSQQWQQIRQFEDSLERVHIGYAFGFQYGHRLNTDLGLETGVTISRKGYKTRPYYTMLDPNDTSGLYEGIAQNFINYHYLDVPFMLIYSKTEKKLTFTAGAGIMMNIFMNLKVKTIPEEPTTTFKTTVQKKTSFYNRLNFSPTLRLGVRSTLNSRSFFRLETMMLYGILGTYDNSYKNVHLWNIGGQLTYCVLF